MNFTHLRTFEAVARTGTVTRAAQLLHVSSSAISLHLRDLKTGTLRLGATDTPARSWVPRVLAAFRHGYPGIRVELYVGNTQHVIARLANRQDDVAVGA